MVQLYGAIPGQQKNQKEGFSILWNSEGIPNRGLMEDNAILEIKSNLTTYYCL